MALDYQYINTVAGNPRYGQVYAVEPGAKGQTGEYHVYQDGTKMYVSTAGNDVLASTWHPPQQTVVAGQAATAAIASGAVSTPATVIEPSAQASAPTPPSPTQPKVINESNAASIAGIPYDTYKAEQNTVNASSPATIAGIPNATYQAEQHVVNESTPASIAGIPYGAATSTSSSAGGGVQTLHEVPGKMEVTSGMTFYQLEERHGWAPGTLEQLNPGLNPRDLQVGSSINIPNATPTQGSTGGNSATATDAAQIGPATSGYPPTDQTKVTDADVRSKIEGWASTGSSSPQDPAKNIIEAAAKPNTDTNPLNIKPHSV